MRVKTEKLADICSAVALIKKLKVFGLNKS